MKRREFIIKSTFAGLALTAATPLLEQKIAAAAPSIKLPKRAGEGERWSPSLKDTPTAAKPSFWLAQEGKPKATIILAANALETNQEAAELLQEYVKKISGATLPITDDSKPVAGAKVLIGRSKFVDDLKLDIPNGHTNAFKEEGYIIKQIGDQLVLAGNDHRPAPAYKGSLFAVIEILQRLGCRWYFPGEFGEVYSRSRDISLPRLDETVKPSLAVRGFWWGMPASLRKNKSLNNDMEQWQTRNRYLPYGLDQYKALYIDGIQLRHDAATKIASWVKNEASCLVVQVPPRVMNLIGRKIRWKVLLVRKA